MINKNIDYVPISRLSRGYAGQMIDKMYQDDSVVFIMRNNEPTAVILSIDDYNIYLNMIRSSARINKKEISSKIAGSLHQFADPEKIDGERDFYKKDLSRRNG
ncbi:MAG: hypothetical protein IKS51_07870 [Erysipelotrichaceae bacterium]|nr:hypothetical protein [Erysipelotrichaceae bacterium]